MTQAQHTSIVNFIWSIADDCLRDVYVRGKYRDVIIPMTVIRRLDAVLESTKEDVLKMKKYLDEQNIAEQHPPLCNASGQSFYNTSPFRLSDLKSRAKQQNLKADFEAYMDGFSSNIQDILDNFKFRNQIPTLIKADVLGAVIEKFTNPDINLSPNPVLYANGTEKIPPLDNHAMGTIFEELIRRFNEENNEEAGEHFTPRDVVKLMANLIFLPIEDKIVSGTYLVYDGACGTGGMLTVAEDTLIKMAEKRNKKVEIHLYGQEINPETYAITKADLLLKGEGREADNMKFGSTLTNDGYPSLEFEFMLSNPPYGKSWKTDMERMGGKDNLKDHRFIISYNGDPEYKMIPRSSDGQMLFLVNMISKMKHSTALGSRIAEVHNGSSLFTGDAGQGESNIRRWIIENDWLEAIIALPENMFYNTGISTYIWLITNRKTPERKGKVQLVDASELFTPLRKNLGKKNCEFSDEQINAIAELINNPVESEKSKIFPNEHFGYYKVTVERPLRLRIDINEDKLSNLYKNAEDLIGLFKAFIDTYGTGSYMDFNTFTEKLELLAGKIKFKLSSKHWKFIRSDLANIDENASPVIKKIHNKYNEAPDNLHGIYEIQIQGRRTIVEYETDSNLRDTEQIPLLEEGGIEAFFKREAIPYVPDAWIDESKTQIGYEISFTRHFYKPVQMRSLQEITADIMALEQETDGLLKNIIGVGNNE